VIQQRMQGYQNALGLAMQALENVIRQQFSPDQIAKVRARVDRLKERLAAAKKELDAKCAELQEKVPPFGGVFLRGAPLGPVPPQQALEQAQAHLEEVRRQKEQGKATQQDLILAEAQVLKAKNDIAQEQSAGEIENLKREVGMSRVQVQSLRQAVQQLHDENASPDKVAPFEAQLKETESKLATQQKQMNDLEDKWLQWREVALRPDSRPMPPAPQALPPELLALEMQLIDLQGQKQLVVSKLQDSERKARAGQITQAEKREVEVQNDVLDKKIDLLKQEIQKQRLAAGIPESQPAGAMMEPSMPGGEGMPGQPHKTGAAK
jgi:hypothetical protein